MPLTRAEAVDASFPQASDFRKHNAGIFPREGIYPDPTTIATAGIAYAGSGWTVGARAFVAEIKRGGAPYTQSYGSARVSNDSNVAAAWTISAAPASGARIDLLCIRVRDTTQGDSSSGAPTDGPSGAARTGFPEFLVVTGTAGTTPARPALPAGYEEIAQIQTPAGAASAAGSTITQTYTFAQTVGGTIYVRTIAERDALVTPLDGDDCYVIATGQTFTYVASAPSGATWVHTAGRPSLGTYTGQGIYSAGGTAPVAARQAGRVHPTGNIVSTSATFTAGDPYSIGSFPAEYAPKTATIILCITNQDAIAEVTVATTGAMTARLSKSFTGTLNLWLQGSWIDKALI